jgi:hypothetical protein
MDSIELQRLERKARLQYEWGRARRALLGFGPAIALIALAASLARRPTTTLVFGASMFVIGVFLLWYGRDLKRAVLPGMAAGLVPLTFSLCANRIGHVCTGESCMMLCMPACVVGGLVAGLGIAAVAHRNTQPLRFWVASSAVALLTGAMGCACTGYSDTVLAQAAVSGSRGGSFSLYPRGRQHIGAEARAPRLHRRHAASASLRLAAVVHGRFGGHRMRRRSAEATAQEVGPRAGNDHSPSSPGPSSLGQGV